MLTKFVVQLRQQALGALALFIVLGGTSYAVATNSIGSAEIRNNSIRAKDIRDGQVSSADVRNASLQAGDFKAGQLPPGPAGPPGEAGSPGISGLERVVTASGPADSEFSKVAIAECPAGKRAIAGDAVIDSGPGVVNVAMIHQIAPSVVTQVPGNVYVDAVELKDGNTDARTWRLLAIAMCANVSSG